VLALIVLASCSPWLVGIAVLWRRIPRDGALPQSAGELMRQRLSVR